MTPETMEALERAGRRVLIHLLAAGIELLGAVEAVVDELASKDKTPRASGIERIEIE